VADAHILEEIAEKGNLQGELTGELTKNHQGELTKKENLREELVVE
jgi:hypothetical protein